MGVKVKTILDRIHANDINFIDKMNIDYLYGFRKQINYSKLDERTKLVLDERIEMAKNNYQ